MLLSFMLYHFIRLVKIIQNIYFQSFIIFAQNYMQILFKLVLSIE